MAFDPSSYIVRLDIDSSPAEAEVIKVSKLLDKFGNNLSYKLDIKESPEAQRAIQNTVKNLEKVEAANKKAAEVASRKTQIKEYEDLRGAAIASAFGVDESTYALERLNGALPRIRYSMYEVSNTFAVAGAALTAFSAGVFVTAARFDRDFANVQRTTGVTGEALQELRQDFNELAQTIPISWENLTNIGTLAGQLGIASENIADFSATVAKFSATTDVTVEAAATALGRLDQLIYGDPNEEDRYQRLASSILAVGVSSVATESQIIAIAQNIASIGNIAGFTRDELVGLAGAMASVGIQPELARGLTARLFGEISSAVAQSSVRLETLAEISGMTAQQFQENWSGDAAGTLLEFLKGIDAEGENARNSLASIGITSVRDVPNILKLAQGYEQVGELLGIAAEGYDKNNELSQQYSVITETLVEKFNLLINSFKVFIAQSGAGVNVLIPFLDVLNNVVRALTDFAATPFGGTFLSITTGFVGIVGILSLLAAGLARGVAAVLAWKVSAIEASIASGALAQGTKVAEVNMRTLAAAMWSTVAASKAVRGALIATGIGAVVALAGGVIAEVFGQIEKSTKSAGDQAKESFGDLSQLTQALQQDTAAMRDAASANNDAAASWDTVKNSVTGATYAIGENTREVIANMAANNEDIQNFITSVTELNAALAGTGAPELDVENILSLAVTDAEAAKEALAAYSTELVNFGVANRDSAVAIQQFQFGTEGLTSAMSEGSTAIDLIAGAIESATAGEIAATTVKRALGGETENLTDLNLNYNDSLRETREALDAAFSEINILSDFASDFQTLVNGVYEGGNSFNYLSDAGRTNLANLQTAIGSTIVAAQVMGVDATEAVAALFIALEAQGISTANLLASVAKLSIPGVTVSSLKQLVAGTKAFSPEGEKMIKTLRGIRPAARSAGGGAAAAAKEIKTLTDYASDLSGVLRRAFEIRFGSTKTLDDIRKSWIDIADATARAGQELRDINADISQLTADRALQEYFLSVAEAYGDTLQAAKIRANLAKIDADLADRNADLAKAQDESSKSLSGNNKAAIENRSTLNNLVDQYQSYLQSLAASGASQQDLAARAQQLKAEFIAQAKQLGFSENELVQYTSALDDAVTIINNVPRNITIGFNANPALQALAEFNAKLEESQRRAQSAAGGINQALDYIGEPEESKPTVDFDKMNTQLEDQRIKNAGYGLVYGQDIKIGTEREAGKVNLEKATKSGFQLGVVSANRFGTQTGGDFTSKLRASTDASVLPNKINEAGGTARQRGGDLGTSTANSFNASFGSTLRLLSNVFKITWSFIGGRDGNPFTPYATGGLVRGPGTGTSDSIPALLSNGEYVIKASAVKTYGSDFFDNLNQMRTPQFAGAAMAPQASGVQMVALSPEDRALLRSVGGSGEVVLYADNEAIARSANAGNRNIVAAGGRP